MEQTQKLADRLERYRMSPICDNGSDLDKLIVEIVALLRSQQPVSGGEREPADERIRTAFEEGFGFGMRNQLAPHQAWAVSKSLHAAIDAEDEATRLSAPQAVGCEWHADDDGIWYPGCDGEPWVFNDGGPAENHVEHCMRCGKPVTIAPPTQQGATHG